MSEVQADPIAKAILGTLESANEQDRNMEAANVVDALFAIARAIERLAYAVEGQKPTSA